MIAAKSPSSTDNSIVPANLGVYAISYGKGGQQVGNVALQFAYNEFTATSRLYANLSFQNVGDAAIRVNKTGKTVTGPVKVKLMLNHGGVDTVMYSWDIKENIGSGQTVKLATDGACKALTDNLVAGDYFYITVAEDSTAFTTGAYSYSSASGNKAGCSLKYTIADKTDLGVEKLSAAVAGVDDSGNAKIDVRFDVTNRGGAKATDVYAQLSYVSSYDENGEPIYSPLDLTNSELYVSQQRYITGELGTLSVNDDLKNGIISLGTDETFYTRDYYITATAYNAILKQYYSTTTEAGWTSGVYNGTTYYYDAKNYISAYAAYMAGQEAVSGWVKGDDSTYYSSKYASLTDAKNAAEAARKMEYVLTESQYNDLTAAQKVGWKLAETSYIPVGYTDLPAAEKVYTAAKADASQDIDKSYCRTVEGAIYAAPALFKGSLTKSLNLRVEVFSSTSNTTLNGAMKVSDHADEYYAQNNAAEQQIEQKTFISAANRITLPLKGIQRLPVSIRTTTGAAPEISVYEVYDGTGTSDGDELGTLYYQADKDTDGVAGTQTGALYITALRSGSGVIHIKDLATNETYPIAYTVADENIGINIFNDNSMFTFYNADGTVFDPDKTGQDWSFDTYLKWPGGSDAPYLDNLAVAKKGAYFTFQTKASKVNLTLENSAALTSNAFIASGMITGTSASHSDATAKIDFSNSTGITHTVKITAASENEPTYFDTLLLEYGAEYKPSDDQNSPGIYFSRSFPVSGSIKDGTAVSLTVYAVDDTGLSALRFNGSAATEVKKTASGLWEYTFNVSQNGSFTIAAEDQNGNQTSRTVTVDWFYTGTTGANTAVTPPALTATIEKHYADKTKQKEDIYANANVTFTSADSDAKNTVVFNATTTDLVGDQITYYRYNKETGAFETAAGISGNGYYMVKAENATNRTFTQQIFYVSIFENLPTVTAVKRANTNVWDWTAVKDEESAAALKSVTLNGVELDSGLATASKSSASGSVTLPYGGAYAFKATDTKGISFTYTVDVTVPVTVPADAVSTAGAWGQPDNTGAQHGRITVDFAKVTGGDYANTGAVTALSQYSGSYEYTVIKTADVKALPGDGSENPDYAWLGNLTWKQSKDNTTEVTAAAGDKTEYTVLIRDKKNPTDYTTMAVLQLTIADNAIDVTSLSAGIASGEKTADGKIYVVADKGETGYYQFAMLPASASLTAADFKADTVTWHNALWTEANPGFGQFDKVLPGKYQIAVRAFYNGGTESTDVNGLFTLGNAIDTAQATLNSLQEARDNAVVSMKIAIDDASRAWQNASADTAAKQAAYDKLMAATPVDNAAADAASDALKDANAAEAAAKAAYETALGAATAAEKQNIIDLHAAWLALGNGDAADKAYAAYTAAVQSLCTKTQQSAYADRITNAKTALASAKTAYDAKDAALAAACKTQYASDSSKWDSMITGTDTQVTVTAGTATALKAIPESSLPTLSTGKVAVTAEGGTAYDGGSVIHYQFAVLRLDDGKKLDFTADMSKIADLGLDWQFADDAKDLPTKHTFTGLSGGTYQVFVREVFDPDSRDGSDINKSIYESGSTDCLYALLTAYQAATAAALPDAVQKLTVSPMSLFAAYETEQTTEKRTAFLDSVGNDAGVAQKLTAWDNAAADKKAAARTELTQAVSAYFTAVKTAERDAAYLAYGTKLAQVKAKAEQAYTQQPGYYDTASYTTVTVGTIALTAIISRTESGNRITFKISNLSNPTLSDAKLILSANADHEVVLEKGDTRIIIPAGMLKSADEVTTIFTNFTAGTGNVVRFTAADGSTEIVPTLIDSGKTSFLYIGRGNYAVTENTVRFRDIAGHWAENSINFTADLTLFNGVGDNRFDPEGTVNRAMVVTVLYRMMGSPSVSGTTPFTDVPSGTWYSDAVLWAYQNGIVDGVTATSYAPMQNMTRQDLVTVICRFLKAYGLLADETGGLDGFKDQSSISAYARDAFSWAVAAGIINGEPGNRLVPTGLATRAQIAAIFERLTHYILG